MFPACEACGRYGVGGEAYITRVSGIWQRASWMFLCLSGIGLHVSGIRQNMRQLVSGSCQACDKLVAENVSI
jgi:hypothetical protein